MATQKNKRLIFSVRSSLHLHRPCLHNSISLFFYSSSQSKSSESNPTAEYLINQHQFSPEAAFKASSTIAYLKNPADSDLVLSFLKDSGFSKTHLEGVIKRIPRILCANLDTSILEFVERVDKMGFDRNSRMFISAIGIMSSMKVETWELKLKLFRSLGFSEKDILAMFRRSPLVFGISERKIKEVAELLLSAGKFDIPFVINNPELLMYSVERRLKPRLEVLEILEKKNLLVEKTKLTSLQVL